MMWILIIIGFIFVSGWLELMARFTKAFKTLANYEVMDIKEMQEHRKRMKKL
ncbi:hypothetical protein ACUW9Z_001057 [Aerococcus sp. 150760007-1]|uniref:Uncharacterized protein n=1 Tax=Aerococcus urinaeequi TaxID=51665 RepID=A0ABR5ZYD4_9LACT|nr:hypothetical protein [Aerococcus urinaeequi]MBA5746675.1 hypothetical protein [Aerococcus urinaeequi]MBA5829530.1 hypothetical protein [Aerococcus urinaeequi]MBA5860363.1 hypothetical protein [Aerococcus urinaeequi]